MKHASKFVSRSTKTAIKQDKNALRFDSDNIRDASKTMLALNEFVSRFLTT